MIEEAEYVLRDLGFFDVRVRHHELPPALGSLSSDSPGSSNFLKTQSAKRKTTTLARIEVGAGEMGNFLKEERFRTVADALKKIGYDQVTLDLHGYRRGSANEVVSR